MRDVLEKIHNYSLEEIMGERFGRYSKYIIQERRDIMENRVETLKALAAMYLPELPETVDGQRRLMKQLADVVPPVNISSIPNTILPRCPL